MSPTQELLVADVDAWRAWLERHHAASGGVLLILAKKAVNEPTRLTYDEALPEAICFGWIDGQLTRRDALTYRVRFTPRRSRSAWSQRNVEIAERLVVDGRMRPAGQAEIDRAKADGRWARAYAGSASSEVPDDLRAALVASPRALAMWEVLTRANRYAVLYRVHEAIRPETRARRIAQYVEMLARGNTPHPQKRKPE